MGADGYQGDGWRGGEGQAPPTCHPRPISAGLPPRGLLPDGFFFPLSHSAGGRGAAATPPALPPSLHLLVHFTIDFSQWSPPRDRRGRRRCCVISVRTVRIIASRGPEALLIFKMMPKTYTKCSCCSAHVDIQKKGKAIDQ